MFACSLEMKPRGATDEDRLQFGPGKSFCIHEGCEKGAQGSTKFCKVSLGHTVGRGTRGGRAARRPC